MVRSTLVTKSMGGTKLSPYLSSGSRYGWRRKTLRTSSSLRQLPAPWLDPEGRLLTCWGRLTCCCCCCLPAGPQGGRRGGSSSCRWWGAGAPVAGEGGGEVCAPSSAGGPPHLPQPPFRGEAARIIHHHTPKRGPHSLRGVWGFFRDFSFYDFNRKRKSAKPKINKKEQ